MTGVSSNEAPAARRNNAPHHISARAARTMLAAAELFDTPGGDT